MNEYLIANVGNRDVQLDGLAMKSPLSKGKKILENFSEYETRLSFPIIQKLVKSRYFDKIYLIVSDQKDQKELTYREKDTFYFGEIIKKAFSTLDIEIIPLLNNPASYDMSFESYASIYHKILKANGIGDALYYIALSGGTCAQNTASLYHGSIIFGDHCQPVYVSEDQEQIQILKTANSILREMSIEHAKNSLKCYEYSSAYELLKNESCDNLALSLIDYADKRSKFQFKKALEILNNARRPRGEELLIISRLKKECISLVEGDYSMLLLELLHLIRKYYNMKMYNEALALLFRFVEGALHYYVESLSEIQLSSPDISSEEKEKLVTSYIRTNESLEVFISNKKINYRTYPLSRPTLSGIIEYFAQEGKVPEQVYRAIKKINAKANDRNKGLFGHGTKYVSGLDPNIFESMEAIASDICMDTEISFVYDEINKLVLNLLDC